MLCLPILQAILLINYGASQVKDGHITTPSQTQTNAELGGNQGVNTVLYQLLGRFTILEIHRKHVR